MNRSKKGVIGGYSYTVGLCPLKIEPKPCFNNASIKAPNKYKPHICKREGWWRVSQMPKRLSPSNSFYDCFIRAHDFACANNEPIRRKLFERIERDEH